MACAIINAHREHLFLALTPERDKWFDQFCSDATFTGALPPAEPLNEEDARILATAARELNHIMNLASAVACNRLSGDQADEDLILKAIVQFSQQIEDGAFDRGFAAGEKERD